MFLFVSNTPTINIRRSETHILTGGQGLNCAKLQWTDELAAKVAHKEVALWEAADELEAIIDAPPIYSPWIKVSCPSLFYVLFTTPDVLF